MAVYLLVPLAQNISQLSTQVLNVFQESDCYRLSGDAGWLLAYRGTTVELCHHVGVTGQREGEKSATGPALAVPVTNYYGRGSPDMWEWLKTRLEASA